SISSASKASTQAAEVDCRTALRAAEKSSVQGTSTILAPKHLAMETVWSCDPVSPITISETSPMQLSRQFLRCSCASRTIMDSARLFSVVIGGNQQPAERVQVVCMRTRPFLQNGSRESFGVGDANRPWGPASGVDLESQGLRPDSVDSGRGGSR